MGYARPGGLGKDDVARGDLEVVRGAIVFDSQVFRLFPANAGETDVRAMRARAQDTGASGVPTEEEKIIGCVFVRQRCRVFPGKLRRFVVAQGLSDAFLDFDLLHAFVFGRNPHGPCGGLG